MGTRRHKMPNPVSQSAQVVHEQTEMIFQDLRKKALQAYIKHKAYYDKKASASKLKQAQYVFVLQPNVGHHGSEILFTDFWWIGPLIIEKPLLNKNSMVRKIDTNKTQALHRMKLRQFRTRPPIPDLQLTSRKGKPVPEVIIKHVDFYARARECKNEKSIFDSDYNNPKKPISPEIAVQPEGAADEMSTIPGTRREIFLELFPQANRSCDGTDTNHNMQPDAETSAGEPDPLPTNPRSSKYDLRHNLKTKCNDDYRY